MNIYPTRSLATGYSNDNGTEFLTSLGRIVWGHPLKATDKTKDDVKVIGPDGQPVKVWSFGVAFPKAEFQTSIWPHLAAEAAKGFPNGAPNNFTYKYRDGDTDSDSKGNPLSGKDGYAGCYILAFSTELRAPECFVFENNAYRQIDETAIKTGDYVQVKAVTKWHAANPNARGSRPGLYVNPASVLLCFQGEALSGGVGSVDPNAVFGTAPPQMAMPAGATMPGAMPAVGNTPLPPATMPGAPSALPVAAASPPPVAPPPAPVGPTRPTDPAHVHDNGNGTEQWFVNGAWDGGAHPVGGATLPPPAAGFVAAAGMPGAMPPR